MSAEALATTRFLSSVEVKDNPNPLPAGHFSIAFGDEIYKKIQPALANEGTPVKIQALTHVIDLLRKPENIRTISTSGVFTELILNLDDVDGTCRRLSSQAVAIFADSRYGREATLKSDLIPKFSKLLTDKETGVRKNTYKILLSLCSCREGLQGMIRSGLTESLIQILNQEPEHELKGLAFQVITLALSDEAGMKAAMAGSVVEAAVAVLKSSRDALALAASAQCVAQVAVPLTGKDKCVSSGSVALLVPLLAHPAVPVRRSVGHALMNLTIAQSGKVATLQAGGLSALLAKATSDSDDTVRVYALQVMANVAEHPSARNSPTLQSSETHKLLHDVRVATSSALVKRAAEQALYKILWKPGDSESDIRAKSGLA